MTRAIVILLVLTVFFVLPRAANAALSDLLGVNKSIDDAVNGMQAVVDTARDAALAIEAQTNQDVTNRLQQVDGVIAKTVSEVKELETKGITDSKELIDKVNAAIAARINDVSSLENKFKLDLADLIYKAECAGDKTLNGNLKDALGSVGRLLGTNEILITPPVMYAGESKSICVPALFDCRITTSFPIRTPFSETYIDIRDYLLNRLNGAREDTPIESIVDLLC